jgi:ATP-dependent Zn protease
MMQESTSDQDDLRVEVALHEAGHAVISRVVGLVASKATIVARGNIKGTACWKNDDGIKSVLACLAGRAATEVILGHATDEGCQGDDEQAMRLLTIGNGHIEREDWYARKVRDDLLRECRKLVRQHRGAVEAVANAMLDRETLSGWEIDRIIFCSES